MERSFGILPLKYEAGEWSVFLIQHQAGHWAFPKGHAEEGEDPQETAARELTEETGLQLVEWLTIPPIEEHYSFQRDDTTVEKTVTYFFALVEGTPSLQEQEIAQGRWVPLQEAHTLATFPETKRLCREIESRLL